MSEESVHSKLLFFVNGRKVVEGNPNPEWTLLWYLRYILNLRGSKLGCGEGGCGACTVMVSKYNRAEDEVLHYAINACLTSICSLHGLAITTVEGIGSTKTKLHAVQERIAKSHGSQCGFCTPGIVMSMYALLRSQVNIKYADLESTLQGNLCRCTGYRPILEGFKTFIEDWENGYGGLKTNRQNGVCGLGENCCKNANGKLMDDPDELFYHSSFKPYDSSQEPIFPPELRMTKKYDEQYLIFKGHNVTWYRPLTLDQLLDIKHKHLEAKVVGGNTEICVEVKRAKSPYPILISPHGIKEMLELTVADDCIVVGSSVTITDFEQKLQKCIIDLPNHKTRIFQALVEMFLLFAGKQIRNVATISGNIMTGSPVSDLSPILMVAGAKLNLVSKEHGNRTVKMGKDFFSGYRQNILLPNEILLSIEIPYSRKFQYLKSFKQSKRRDDDIAIVTAAFNVEFEDCTDIIETITLAFGGMAPTTVLADKTGFILKGEKWNERMLGKAFDSLLQELSLASAAPGGMVQYRRSLTLSLFFKFYLSILEQLSIDYNKESKIAFEDVSAIEPLRAAIPNSSQYYTVVGDTQASHDAVGRPVPHVSAMKHATGEAQYCDDIPSIQGELHLALVLSTKAHANILSINATEALQIAGVEAFFSAADLAEEHNIIGPVVRDEEIFVSKTVCSQGCVIGAIVAKDKWTAQQAAQNVYVAYEELPAVITIEDAIAQNSYYDWPSTPLRRGDINKAFGRSDHVVEGVCRSGGQEHFYLETHAALAIPKDGDEMEIICSNQQSAETARIIAKVLDIPNNKVVTKVKRVGGGFGGKESRSMLLTLPVAIAAHKLGRPVRAMLDRDEDMRMTGNRHPFYTKYKVSFDNNGIITGARFHIYCNAGCSMDVSCVVNLRAKYHIDNAYRIPNVEIFTYECKTNVPSNTAFRGFGAPQAMLVAETYMRHIAYTLKKTYEEIVSINIYQEGDLTHYNQPLSYCTLQRCWDECIAKSRYFERKAQIKQFNSVNRWKKKGLSIVPAKHGIAFQSNVLMQAGALVHIYADGSVLLTHGGIEMGQGLHTKMIQVASRVLEIEMSKIYISETSTDTVPNGIQTAASISSDLNGMAVLRACEVIKGRLKPYKDKNPSGKWENWIEAASMDRVSLSATGFYASPLLEYDEEKNQGSIYQYFTYGVACSEVIIDCLTGDHQVLRTDIVMDVGSSLNPAIDIGQIEGAFMQGYGYCTMEELIYSPTGTLYSRGPGAYKIPGFADIPRQFNVSLLKGAPNPRAVYSSKGVGEPPLSLAFSIFFAIKEAISDARMNAGHDIMFKLDSPATVERIRMACEDSITSKTKINPQQLALKKEKSTSDAAVSLIDHGILTTDILLAKLQHNGVRDQALKLMESFLNRRKQ